MRFFRSKDSCDFSPATTSAPPLSPTVTGPARPIRFVYCDEEGKFRLDPQALAVLQVVKDPIGVVAVCGRARQGKSFILNQILGRSSGFQVASTHRPCTKGLWLWSAPIKRTALDGTMYNLILLDTEGIDAYDQTGTYSTQIFSLAVLLSSLLIYNQMGGIDEAALDRLSLVTEMTKHIRVRATSGGRTSASELGQYSPIFIWLLRDFYLDLAEDNGKITPRDYLERVLRSVQGCGKDIAAKNEVRQSICALFPDRECFTLVRPLNSETELQQLDQTPLDKLRPEFQSGLDALTRFVLERTRPKQVGATIMNGPMLAGIAQSFLDALNRGAVPTITSSWQSVEETECRRAYDSATEMYLSSFDKSKLPEEAALREAHEEAVQKALAIFNANAVGIGSAREKYEKLLQSFLRKAFEDYKRNAYMDADLHCSNVIHDMKKRLRKACHDHEVTLQQVFKVVDSLVSEYEALCHGPGKDKRLALFLHQSLEGPIFQFANKQIDEIGSERVALELKCQSTEDKMGLLSKQLEASEKQKSEYLKRYEDAITDKKRMADDYMNYISNLESRCSSVEERCSSLLRTLDLARKESLDWKKKYEWMLSKQKAEEDEASSEVDVLKSKSSATEASLAAVREQAQSALEEAEEWKRKYHVAAREAKSTIEKAADTQDRANKSTQLREDALRAEFAKNLAEKEEELKDKVTKINDVEQQLRTLKLDLKAAESEIKNYDTQVSNLKLEIKVLAEKLEAANASALSYEREAKILEQEKLHLEEKYRSEFNRFDESHERCVAAEKEARRASEVADKALAEAANALKEKSDIQRISMERLTHIEKVERQILNLERQKKDLTDEVETLCASTRGSQAKMSVLEARVEEREKEIEVLMKSNNEQRASTVQVLENLLETERKARAEANQRAEALSVQLQATQSKLDLLQQELTCVRLNESALDAKLKTASHGKRLRADYLRMGVYSVEDAHFNDKLTLMKKQLRRRSLEDGGPVFSVDEDGQQKDSEDYTMFTVQKLKDELVKNGFGAELLKLANPSKIQVLALYETCVLQKY